MPWPLPSSRPRHNIGNSSAIYFGVPLSLSPSVLSGRRHPFLLAFYRPPRCHAPFTGFAAVSCDKRLLLFRLPPTHTSWDMPEWNGMEWHRKRRENGETERGREGERKAIWNKKAASRPRFPSLFSASSFRFLPPLPDRSPKKRSPFSFPSFLPSFP